jgi:hypothetical protein
LPSTRTYKETLWLNIHYFYTTKTDLMEPIPFFFDSVRRTAIVIKPKQPFLDWLIKIDQENDSIDIKEDQDVYLLPVFDEMKQMENWLKKNFDQIFCDQMNNWYITEDLWVQNRTLKLFKEWFDYSFHTTVLDFLDEPIQKD